MCVHFYAAKNLCFKEKISFQLIERKLQIIKQCKALLKQPITAENSEEICMPICRCDCMPAYQQLPALGWTEFLRSFARKFAREI